MAINLENNTVLSKERRIELSRTERSENELFQDVLTAEEAARFLRISISTLYQLVKEGALPLRRIGTRLIFGRQALLKWVNEI